MVEVKEDGSTMIFYKQLLPRELFNILKHYETKNKQGSKRIELRPLSETSLYSISRKFLDERKNQPISLIENNPFSGDEILSEFSLSSLTYDPNRDETSNIFDHDFVIYGEKGNLKVPLQIGRIQAYSTIEYQTFTVGGKTYTFKVKTTRRYCSSFN